MACQEESYLYESMRCGKHAFPKSRISVPEVTKSRVPEITKGFTVQEAAAAVRRAFLKSRKSGRMRGALAFPKSRKCLADGAAAGRSRSWRAAVRASFRDFRNRPAQRAGSAGSGSRSRDDRKKGRTGGSSEGPAQRAHLAAPRPGRPPAARCARLSA